MPISLKCVLSVSNQSLRISVTISSSRWRDESEYCPFKRQVPLLVPHSGWPTKWNTKCNVFSLGLKENAKCSRKKRKSHPFRWKKAKKNHERLFLPCMWHCANKMSWGSSRIKETRNKGRATMDILHRSRTAEFGVLAELRSACLARRVNSYFPGNDSPRHRVVVSIYRRV